LAFTTVRSATGVDFIGTPGVDVGTFFDETGMVVATASGDADIITIFNSTDIQRTTTLDGGDGADTINVGVAISDSSINGNGGADTIVLTDVVANTFVGGGNGADIIGGGTQWLSALVNGGAGNDTINVAPTIALTTIQGLDGNDVINLVGGSLNTVSINGNAGDDVIITSKVPGTLNYTLSGLNFIGGGAGNDVIDFLLATTDGGGAAFSKGFELTGGAGNDVINGSTENDTIWGNADNDTIRGAEGRDTIYAGAGKDTIGVNDSGDVITGGAGGDVYSKLAPASSTFLINSIAESAAAITGTAAAATLTFDSFTGYAFAAGDVLDISAVTNQLAGSPYTGSSSTSAVNIGGPINVATFAELKTTLDGLGLAASTSSNIRAYSFFAAVGEAGTPVESYTWIQDSINSYSSSDLLFKTAAGGFGPNSIILV
jgi:Ca2+-binding RTX toxin-like protein